MAAKILSIVPSISNRALRPLGVRISRLHDRQDPKQFLPFAKTMKQANDAGLSLGDYVDVRYNVAGATQQTIEGMRDLGVFSGSVETIVEVGPGSGRYLEKVFLECSPKHYEIYETAEPWAQYLERTYDVVKQPTDGWTLSSTPNASADLVHAHKVFVATTFLTVCSYWFEMIRTVRPSGYIVFDIMNESCLEPGLIERWLEPRREYGVYPAIVPRDLALSFFTDHGATLVGSFYIPMRPGRTETFVFRRDSA